jgi:predicted amidophosphoribosyltransferase
LAQNLSAIYCPEVLRKKNVTPSMHTLATKMEREETINGCYTVSNSQHQFNNKNILIIDDVCTSGTTIKEIIRALKEVWPNGHYYFCFLGKTKRNKQANDHINQHYF